MPYLMYHGFGITDAETVLEQCQIFYGALFIGCMPFLSYLLFRSAAVAAVSPVVSHLILGTLLYGRKTSPYYAMAWGTVLSFLILCILLKREWERWPWGLAAAECAVIAMSNFVRTGSMLFREIAFIAVLIYKEHGRLKIMRGGV